MKHVVVGIVSKINTEGEKEYLLVSSKKDFKDFTGAYYPPGGHLEGEESEESALVRELQEELGLNIKPTYKIAETGADVADQTTHWWECDIVDGELKINDQELADANYFSEKEIKELKLWPATKKFFEDYIFNELNENREVKKR